MRIFLILLLLGVFGLGCAKMQVGGTKEPIKLDIAMRLDVYQHVEKDIDAIENIVSGSADSLEPKEGTENQSFLRFFIGSAYAEEGLSPEVEAAALRRKGRLGQLSALEAKGVIGENQRGFVEVRDPQNAGQEASQVVSAENSDRMVIYQEVARKNGTSVSDVEKLYAIRLQNDAPAGTPIETQDGWRIK